MPLQSFIEVKLVDKTKVRGRLEKIDTDGFIVTTPGADHASAIERTISFSEVKSAKQVKDQPGAGEQIARTAGRVALKTVVVVATIAAIGAIVGAVAH